MRMQGRRTRQNSRRNEASDSDTTSARAIPEVILEAEATTSDLPDTESDIQLQNSGETTPSASFLVGPTEELNTESSSNESIKSDVSDLAWRI